MSSRYWQHTSLNRTNTGSIASELAESDPKNDGTNISPVISNRFESAIVRVKDTPHFVDVIAPLSPYGYFKGRQIIGDWSPINQGIYIGRVKQEAVVVDDKYGELEQVYERLLNHIGHKRGCFQGLATNILVPVWETVELTIPLDYKRLSSFELHRDCQSDDKIMLDAYIRLGAGLERHRVLLGAYLIERLRNQGYLNGSPLISAECSFLNGDSEKVNSERLMYLWPGSGPVDVCSLALNSTIGRSSALSALLAEQILN